MVSQSVSQSVVKSVNQSKAKLFFPMYKKEKEKEKQKATTYVYVYSPIYLIILCTTYYARHFLLAII